MKFSIITNRLILFLSAVFLCSAMSWGQIWQIGYPNAADVIATLNNDTLTISGTGEMKNLDFGDNDGGGPPWYSYRSSIKTVDIRQGVTSTGSMLFPLPP